jgi:alpha-tubulin suppressor-like RCC1 family protein
VISRYRSFRIVAPHAWALLGVALLACSSSDETRPRSTETDAGDAGAVQQRDASSDVVDAGQDAGEDAAALPPPPPYDFAVECTANPCVTRIAASGGGHACAVLHDGTARCWGSNASGQLGTGASDAGAASEYEATPRRVVGISNATSVAAVGRGTSGSSCVISGAGDVACFGSNVWGQLGRASEPSSDPHPEPVVIDALRAKSVTLAGKFALAVGTDGRLWSWGANDAFQLARQPSVPPAGPSSPPARADRISSSVRACAGTQNSGFVLAGSGELLSWGGGTAEQLGRMSSLSQDPVPAPIVLSDVSSVTAGATHACALSRGNVHCWGGKNEHGQLGTGVRAKEMLPTRVALPKDVYPVAVAAGGNDTCAIAATGELYCWGANGAGQLGVEARRDQPNPTRIEGLTEQVVGVAVMDDAVCALLRNGSVACWGDNLVGQLGRGSRDTDIHVEAAPVIFQ